MRTSSRQVINFSNHNHCIIFNLTFVDSGKKLTGAVVASGTDKFNMEQFNARNLNDTCGIINEDFTYANTISIVCDR